jgi:mRNA interferase MazF
LNGYVHRPALVLSPAEYNSRTGLALLCPITSQKKGYPFEVELPRSARLSGRISERVSGIVLADQIKNADWRARRAQFAGNVPDSVLVEIAELLRPLLGI